MPDEPSACPAFDCHRRTTPDGAASSPLCRFPPASLDAWMEGAGVARFLRFRNTSFDTLVERDIPAPRSERTTMTQKITTFLGFNDQCEEAVKLYTSIFKNSRIVSTQRYGDAGPGPKGSVMSMEFELEGQRFMALNGGPSFTFTVGMSLFVDCATQHEVDELWEKLMAGGGKPGPCGWLTDRFGVSWQIVPTALGRLLGDPNPERSRRVMEAMLKMSRLEIAQLEAAARL